MGKSTMNGVDVKVLEWDVSSKDIHKAFESIPSSNSSVRNDGGILRLFVAPQLGHVVVRVEHADRLGLVQGRMDYADFKEVAKGLYFPNRISITKGSVNRYDIRKVENINGSIPKSEFVLNIPGGVSVEDSRPRTTDNATRTYNIKEYAYRHFRTAVDSPNGFPPELLRELDRNVVESCRHE